MTEIIERGVHTGCCGAAPLLGIVFWTIIFLGLMMAFTNIKWKISSYIRKTKIRSEGQGHVGDLMSQPQKMLMLCLNFGGTLLTIWQTLKKLILQSHVNRPMRYLLKIIHNHLIKQKLRVGSSGIKRK
jgi:hypothetical protein